MAGCKKGSQKVGRGQIKESLVRYVKKFWLGSVVFNVMTPLNVPDSKLAVTFNKGWKSEKLQRANNSGKR